MELRYRYMEINKRAAPGKLRFTRYGSIRMVTRRCSITCVEKGKVFCHRRFLLANENLHSRASSDPRRKGPAGGNLPGDRSFYENKSPFPYFYIVFNGKMLRE